MCSNSKLARSLDLASESIYGLVVVIVVLVLLSPPSPLLCSRDVSARRAAKEGLLWWTMAMKTAWQKHSDGCSVGSTLGTVIRAARKKSIMCVYERMNE